MKLTKIIFSVVLTLLVFVVSSCGTMDTHTYTDWEFVKEPTLTEGGQAKRECTDCHQVELVGVPALFDYSVWSKESVDPTVETTGTDTYTSIYGVIVVVVDKIDYRDVTWTIVTEPTLSTEGRAKYLYEAKGYEGEISIPNLADTTVWEVNTSNATCLEDGLSTYTSVYGMVEVTLPATGHSYSAWSITVEPTTTTEGKAVRTCANCSEQEEMTLPVLTDSTVWTKTTTAATCASDGKDEYSSEYGNVVITKAALGHSYGAWSITKEPTLAETGSASRTCSTCNDVETVTLPVLSDELWTKVVTPATCTQDGKEEYTSEYGKVTVVLMALGHSYGAWNITTEPTLTTEGSASRTCATCSDVETTAVPSLSNTDVWTKETVKEPSYNENGKDKYTSVYGVVELETLRIALPYEGKTYSDFAFDAEENGGFKYGVVSCETAWNTATVAFDSAGIGIGEAFPFRGKTEIKLIDETTGKLEITVISPKYDDDNNVSYPEENATVYIGYVDFATGLIVRQFRSSFNYPLVYTPFEVGTDSSNAKCSSFAQCLAMSYVYDETTYNMFISNDRVYFGVTFTDALGNTVAAEDCYNAPYVYVKDSEGKLIKGFAFDGEKEVEVDGLEGTYTCGDNSLTVSGFGTVSYLGADGTYTVSGEDGKIGVYVDGAYYDVVLNKGDKTCTIDKPMVTVTFVSDKTSVAAMSLNKNVACELPTPENADYKFVGWYLDKDLKNKVADSFVPTEDIMVYASWKLKVVITLVGVMETDPSTIVLGEGDVIGDYLPTYSLDLENRRIFKGWYLDDTYETALPEEAEVTLEDSGIIIYAKWENLAPYYGSYYVTEVYNEKYGNYSGTLLNIDENGNITGKWTGVITDYNKDEQKITWKKSATSSSSCYFWFDEVTGLLVTSYSGQNKINNDLYVGILGAPDKSIAVHYGLKDGNSTWLTRLLEYNDANGVTHTSVIYNTHIYADVTLKTTTGTTLTVAQVASSSTLVCCTSEDTCLFAYAANGTSFSGSGVVALDSYYGTYTSADDTVILDGTGKISYNDKTGTYTKVEGKEYGFDVYLENNTEYYELTLDGTSFTMVKPMVTITYVTGEGHNEKAASTVNKNIPFEFEDLAEDNYVFNGWYSEATYENKVTSVTPTDDVVVYAKWSAPATLTINYNNGEASEEVIYSVGDTVTLPMPEYAKHCFDGWYTTEEYTEGTEWTNGSTISVDTIIYAKWSAAPIYNNKYMPTEVSGKSTNGDKSYLYTRTGAIANIDPYGKATGTSYPFRGDIEIKDYNEATGTLIFKVQTSEYHGYIDKASGIIILPYSATDKLGPIYFLTPFETVNNTQNFSSSYWNAGLTRCVEYTFGGTTYRAFIDNEVVYFNVTFTDLSGNNVAGVDCYKASTLFVKDSEGNLIKKYGFDGTTMQALDGFEGTYSNNESTLVLNGVDKVTLDGVDGTYAKTADGASYMFDVYLNKGAAYYELSVNTDEKTFTINKPMVTVSYDCDSKAEEAAVTVNKNIAYALPVLTNTEYVFRGWYTDNTYATKVADSYVPTKDVTLYAKWDAKFTLTVVYGNTLENATIEYGAGDTIAPVQPPYTNNLLFEGWYTDADCTIKLTDYVINSNMMIYCKWQEANALFGSYAGFEVWGSSTSGSTVSGGSSAVSLKVSADGKVSGKYTGIVYNYDATTGYFRFAKSESDSSWYVGYYFESLGILVYNYSTTSESSANQGLGVDVYVLFKDATKATTGGLYSCYWTKGTVKLLAVTATGFAKDSFLVFIDGNNVYFDVTYTSTDGEVESQDAYKANQLSIFDSNGKLIKSYTRDASLGLVED